MWPLTVKGATKDSAPVGGEGLWAVGLDASPETLVPFTRDLSGSLSSYSHTLKLPLTS